MAGCAADTDTLLDITYDPCVAEVVADSDAMAEQVASLDAALALWNERGGFRLRRSAEVTPADPNAPPPLVVHFASLGAFRGYYNDERGEIHIHRGLRASERMVAIAHELGHAFGLWHVERDVRRSVMNPGNVKIEPTPQDVEDVRALWGSCD